MLNHAFFFFLWHDLSTSIGPRCVARQIERGPSCGSVLGGGGGVVGDIGLGGSGRVERFGVRRGGETSLRMVWEERHVPAAHVGGTASFFVEVEVHVVRTVVTSVCIVTC